MQDEPLEARLRRDFGFLRSEQQELERIYAIAPSKGNTAIPSSTADRINEVLRDLAEAGADPELRITNILHIGLDTYSNWMMRQLSKES